MYVIIGIFPSLVYGSWDAAIASQHLLRNVTNRTLRIQSYENLTLVCGACITVLYCTVRLSLSFSIVGGGLDLTRIFLVSLPNAG